MRPTSLALLVICVAMIGGVFGCSRSGVPSLRPGELHCEYRSEPRGIDERAPRLSWTLTATDVKARGLRQTAYQIWVASSLSQLLHGQPDLWDSGKVDSDQTHDVVYAGRPLVSREHCWWRVCVWDQANRPSVWSGPARWSMGLLSAADWKGQWIGFDAPEPTDGSILSPRQRAQISELSWIEAAMPASITAPQTAYLRRSFTLPTDRAVARATLILSPDQTARVTMNGRPIARVARWDRARPLDLTGAVAAGENILGLQIEQQDGYPPAALGEIEIDFAQGEPLRLPFDHAWTWARAAKSGWDAPGFDARLWAPVNVLADHKSSWKTPQNSTRYLAPPPYLRKSFVVAKAVRRATVYATALGFYELYLNGERVGRDYFTPGWTDYRYRVQYQTYDVTDLLRPGSNVWGAILGDGWFAGTAAFTGKGHIYGGLPRLAGQSEIDYADGTRDTVATDGSWRAEVGPVRYADLYQGCAIDERRTQPNWATPDFDASSWHPVATGWKSVPNSTDAPPRLITAANIDPVRVSDQIQARAVTSPRPGVYVLDFGQNLVGWVRWRVQGKPGQKLTVRHGEMLNPNGTLYTSNLRGAAATDVYWLRGGGEILEPVFTVHGFRYAEITGLDAPPALGAATAVVVHSALARTGDFSSSDPRVNQLFHNIIWGQKGNYLEVPTDCPQRDERLGWTGDTQFFLRTGSYNYDVEAFIERWLTTLITDEQGDDGTFPDVAPSIGREAKGITAWGDAAIVCTYTLWKVYGDTRIIERHYDSLARYLGWMQAHAKAGVAYVGGYGDWVNLGGGATPPVMDTAYYSYLCGLMAEMGRVIHRPAYAAFYDFLQHQEIGIFQRDFVLPNGTIRDSSQTGFALAFTMNLLPPELKAKAADQFVASIAARNWHLATGFIGTPRLLPALHAAGRDDVAYRLLLQDTFPSWLFQVKLGATTMWERWDGWTPDRGFQTINMNSFNHYAFGSVGEYLYRFVAGIDTDGSGFRKILIQPQPEPGLTSARASYDAVTGPIVSDWHLADGVLTLDVTIPPNTTATVCLPTKDPARVREGGRLARKAEGVTPLSTEAGLARFEIGSGTYRFTAPAR